MHSPVSADRAGLRPWRVTSVSSGVHSVSGQSSPSLLSPVVPRGQAPVDLCMPHVMSHRAVTPRERRPVTPRERLAVRMPALVFSRTLDVFFSRSAPNHSVNDSRMWRGPCDCPTFQVPSASAPPPPLPPPPAPAAPPPPAAPRPTADSRLRRTFSQTRGAHHSRPRASRSRG